MPNGYKKCRFVCQKSTKLSNAIAHWLKKKKKKKKEKKVARISHPSSSHPPLFVWFPRRDWGISYREIIFFLFFFFFFLFDSRLKTIWNDTIPRSASKLHSSPNYSFFVKSKKAMRVSHSRNLFFLFFTTKW